MSMPHEIPEKHRLKIKELKSLVEDSAKYQKENNNRYHEFIRFVYASALGANELSTLTMLKKPDIEFNVLEAYLNRLMGEFIEIEPNYAVRAADGIHAEQLTDNLTQACRLIEDYLREKFGSSTTDSMGEKIYKSMISGGFSVAKVYTDYMNEMSFEQDIYIEKVFDPTLCGWDPLARQSHKGDGQYCFEIIPRTKEEFEEKYGKESTIGMTFARDFEGFNWSYENENKKILLTVDLYKKERKKVRIAKLSNGHVIRKKHYKELVEMWNAKGFIQQAPIIVMERTTFIEKICRYQLCENAVLDYTETNFKYFPLVFFDGNSEQVRQTNESPTKHMTRPLVYQAKGMQKLKNFAGQTVASEIENMVQHKFIVSAEAIPEDYQEAYKNVQVADVLVYNAFYKKNPEMPLAPPQVVDRTTTPPIVESTFIGADSVIQHILGSYDAQMGIADGRVSGTAIKQGAMQSNAAARPYLMGYIDGLNRVGQIILDLIPKYFVTPRSLPVKKANGIRSYQVINDETNPQSFQLNYDPNSLQIKIEAGVNSELQKQNAFEKLIQLMGASEGFAQFMNTEGIETLLENVSIRGVDELKLKAKRFMEKMQQMQEQASNQPAEVDKIIQAEVETELARIEQKREQAEGQLAIDAGKLANEKEKTQLAYLELMAKIEEGDLKSEAELERQDAESAREAIKVAVDLAKHASKQA
jgi:uncharacterized membrane protein